MIVHGTYDERDFLDQHPRVLDHVNERFAGEDPAKVEALATAFVFKYIKRWREAGRKPIHLRMRRAPDHGEEEGRKEGAPGEEMSQVPRDGQDVARG